MRYSRRPGPGRPRKYGEDLKKLQAHVPESTYDALYEMKETLGVSLPELLTWLVRLAKGNIEKLKILAQYTHLREYISKLEKKYSELEAKFLKLQDDYERVLKERDALREEVKALKAELAELKRQLKMSARERQAEDLRLEIYEILDKYGRDGSIKMLDLLKRLGYSGDYLRHAKEFLERWFVDQGRILVSEELGLVVEKDLRFRELGWIVRVAKRDEEKFRSSGITEGVVA
ncbi:coiled-coil domain-containing protein [Pyrococcus kukulkanii]|uniref:Uncharacterized protein n=1 Tax=Pyrococcus kukulkanii TaxID=1609559 RepID=A0A127B8B7_9EURY|nr:hypothetical protein [Pyrococcus kukulkanii]AMM53505.1 hypothetical protein TQ32_02625 [Pyrococcus kukulkanii]